MHLSSSGFNEFSKRYDFKSTYLSSTGFNTFMYKRNKSNHGSVQKPIIRGRGRRNFMLDSFDQPKTAGTRSPSKATSNHEKEGVSAIGGDVVQDHSEKQLQMQ